MKTLKIAFAVILLALCLPALKAQAQMTDNDAPAGCADVKDLSKYAEYPGGPEAMFPFFAKNIKVPAGTAPADLNKKLMACFWVTQSGAIANVKVLKGVSPALDAEAIRVIKLMPAWTPAESNGAKVCQKMVLPVFFAKPASAK